MYSYFSTSYGGDIITDKKERFWERKADDKSSTLMIGFIITIIVMLVVVTIMAGYGYARYQDWTRRPHIHVERSLFKFHDEVHDDKVNITVHVFLRNRGEKDTGPLELEWLIMPSDWARDNYFIERGRRPVESMDVDETINVTLEFRLSEGDYRIVYRTYEDGYFSYEGRQSLSVTDEDVEEEAPPADDAARADADDMPSIPFVLVLIILVFVTLIRRKKDEKR